LSAVKYVTAGLLLWLESSEEEDEMSDNDSPQKYTYSFVPKANPACAWGDEVHTLFLVMNYRIELIFEEIEFKHFRQQVERYGFELHEVERVPFHEPESVPR